MALALILMSACGPGELTTEEAQSLIDAELGEGQMEVTGVRSVSETEAVARVLSKYPSIWLEASVNFERFNAGWRPNDIEIASQQLRTMAMMNDIAIANGTMRVDTGRYASSLGELEESGYMTSVPLRDGWDNEFEYLLGDGTYTLRSFGSDGRAGPNPPADWTGPPYQPDIVLTSGAFAQAPRQSFR